MQYIQFNGNNASEVHSYTNRAISIKKSSAIPNTFECWNHYDFVCFIKNSDYIYRDFKQADWEITSAKNFESINKKGAINEI